MKRIKPLLAAAGLVFAGGFTANAQTIWSATPGSSDFNTAANWSAGLPNINTPAQFGNSTITSLGVSANINMARIQTVGTSSSYSFTVASGVFMNLNRTAAGSYLSTDNGTTNLTFNGPGTVQIISSAPASSAMTMSPNAGSTITFNSNVTSSVTNPSGSSLQFNTGGTFVFNGAASFSGFGQVNINSGASVALNNDIGSNSQIRLTGNGARLNVGKTMTNAFVTDLGTSNSSTTGGIYLTGANVDFNRFIGWATAPSSGTTTVNLGSNFAGTTTNTLSSNLTVYAPTGTGSANIVFSASANNTLKVTGLISGANNAVTFKKEGAGTVLLNGSAANTYATTNAFQVNAGTLALQNTSGNAITGNVSVASGATLRLDAANQLADTGSLTLSGGTFNVNGFSESLGALTTTASSVLDFGSGTSTLLFSNLAAFSGTLAVTNWTFGSDSLRFTSNLGLNASAFTVNGGSAAILNQGSYYEVVPEPSTWMLLALGLTALVVFRHRRRA